MKSTLALSLVQFYGENVFLKNESTRNAPFIHRCVQIVSPKREGRDASFTTRPRTTVHYQRTMQ